MFNETPRTRKILIGWLMSTIFYSILGGGTYLFFEDLASSLLLIAPIAMAIAIFLFWHLRMHHDYTIGDEYPMEDGFFLACSLYSVLIFLYALLTPPASPYPNA